MTQLKKAWELASERIIVSKLTMEIEREKQKEREIEKDRLDTLPEFVSDWEHPDEAESEDSPFVEKKQSKLFNLEEIKKHQKKERIEKKIKETYMTKVQEPETIHENDFPEVHWYGHFTSYSGFSRMNRAMAFGLSNKGVKVKIDIQKGPVDINDATMKELELLSNIEISPTAPKIYGATIPLSSMHQGKKIIYTMMETSETLHKDYVERLNLFHEVWVPTKYGEYLCKKNGVRPPIKVMPLGVDVKRYTPETKPLKIPLKKFVFLSVFKWGYRKGYDILLKAYLDEFSSHDNVSLLMVTRTDVNHEPHKIANDFKMIRNGIAKKDEELPHISLYDTPVPEKDMPKIYATGSAFCLFSRGEGFCLPVYEAAASGLPIISTNCSGQTDLLTHENSYLVDPDEYVTVDVNRTLPILARHCGFYEGQTFPDFGTTGIETAKKLMRKVYEDYGEAAEKAIKLREYVVENCSWDKAVEKVYNRIIEIRG